MDQNWNFMFWMFPTIKLDRTNVAFHHFWILPQIWVRWAMPQKWQHETLWCFPAPWACVVLACNRCWSWERHPPIEHDFGLLLPTPKWKMRRKRKAADTNGTAQWTVVVSMTTEKWSKKKDLCCFGNHHFDCQQCHVVFGWAFSFRDSMTTGCSAATLATLPLSNCWLICPAVCSHVMPNFFMGHCEHQLFIAIQLQSCEICKDVETVKLWNCAAAMTWNHEAVKLWCCEAMKLWLHQTVSNENITTSDCEAMELSNCELRGCELSCCQKHEAMKLRTTMLWKLWISQFAKHATAMLWTMMLSNCEAMKLWSCENFDFVKLRTVVPSLWCVFSKPFLTSVT